FNGAGNLSVDVLRMGSGTPTAVPTYHISGGSLNTNVLGVGFDRAAQMLQTGGTVDAANIVVRTGAPGESSRYDLQGGALHAQYEGVGDGDTLTGTLRQTGASN